MKEQFHIVLITVALFGAGLIAGVWTQRNRPIPPPPAPVLGEFRSVEPPGVDVRGVAPGVGGFAFGFGRATREHAAVIAAVNARVAELKPKIRAFQAALDGIETNFLARLDKVLAPDQRTKLAQMRAREAPQTQDAGPLPPPPFALQGPAMMPPPPGAGGGFSIVTRTPFPLGGWLLMSMVVYQPSLDYLTAELKLDSSQQAAIKSLMAERRTNLLALIDKTPPPTLDFGELLP